MPPRGMGFASREAMMNKLREPTPKTLAEVPGYIRRVVGKTAGRLFYIFKIVWNTKKWIFFSMAFMALYNGVKPVIGAVISANLLNVIAYDISNKTVDGLYLALALQFGFLLFSNILSNVYGMMSRIANELVTNKIKVMIMEKSKEVDLSSFDQPDFYERLENASREAGMRPIQILDNALSVVSLVISTASFIAVIMNVMPLATLFIIAAAIPGAVISFTYRKKNYSYMRWHSVERRKMNYYSDVMVDKDLVKEVKIFGLSDMFIGEFKNVYHEYFSGIKKLIFKEGFWNILIMLAGTAVNCLMYVLIARNVVFENGLIGNFSLYTGAFSSIASGVSSLISTSASIYEGTLFIDNLILFMNEKKSIVPLDEAKKPTLKRHTAHTVTFDHVSFRYPGVDHDVLHDINLTINGGDTCVLVGLNGAGKTTLIKLLTRLYDPTEGTIYLDGHDIREYDIKDLYAMYGIIFQDFGKYAFSVTDNIRFSEVNREINMDEIVDAAERSAAAEFIDRLPLKYDTPLMRYFSQDGLELSIGQWQKLSVARAFYSDSDFLILDEPTASLDAIAEQEIFSEFDELRKDKTTIFVSHRLSSATVASKIIVLEHGRVIEQGNHKELMDAKGRYYELFSTQAKRYIASESEGVLGDTMPEQSGMGGFPPFHEGGMRPPMPDGKMPPMPKDGRRPPLPREHKTEEKNTIE